MFFQYLSAFSPNAGKCEKNTDQNNSKYGLFLRNVRKANVLENSKIYYANFYEMDFMKSIVLLEKVDELFNILKSQISYIIPLFSKYALVYD